MDLCLSLGTNVIVTLLVSQLRATAIDLYHPTGCVSFLLHDSAWCLLGGGGPATPRPRGAPLLALAQQVFVRGSQGDGRWCPDVKPPNLSHVQTSPPAEPCPPPRHCGTGGSATAHAASAGWAPGGPGDPAPKPRKDLRPPDELRPFLRVFLSRHAVAKPFMWWQLSPSGRSLNFLTRWQRRSRFKHVASRVTCYTPGSVCKPEQQG